MMTTVLIAIAAGLTAATMFSSIASGAFVSLLLFYLAPLPLMVLALGWGPLAGIIGGSVAALGLLALFGLPYALAFAVTVALPALWLGHLVLLARETQPAANSVPAATPSLDWYPIGRILTWIAGFASITTIAALLTLGTDETAINGALRRALGRLINAGLSGQNDAVADRTLDALVALAPGAATMIAMLSLTLNLWLAGKVTATSQRLKRPWPDLRTVELPRTTLAVLVVALLLCLTGGLSAMSGRIVGSALLLAYGMVGFAVLHTVSLAMAGRTFMLSGLYAITLFIGWPMLGAMTLGIVDAIFGIRRRYWQKQTKLPSTTI
jgi:hypothetical protein